MNLKDDTGKIWRVHFHHKIGRYGRKTVECLIHFGPCTLTYAEPKHCITGSVGSTACSESDAFRGGVGHKIAFERAISKFSRSLRTALWNSYWALTNKPKSHRGAFASGQKRKLLALANRWDSVGLGLCARELRSVLGAHK